MKSTVPPKFYLADVGSGSFRAGYSSDGGICMGIGNYPGAQASTPSLVSLAPSRLIYEPQEEGPAKPVAFGYVEPRQHQVVVENVKLAILADRKAYEYAYSLLDSASKQLRLKSVEQIPEDFLRLLVAHVIGEGGGQPTEGWVFSVPQCYSVTDVQRYRSLIQRAGAVGPIHIYGESDSVMNTSMEWIKNFTRAEQQAAFKQGRNFSIAAAVCDFGDGTTDVATANICFHVDGAPPTMEEKRAPLGFGIGGNAFDGRFVDVLCAKLDLDMPLDRKQHAFIAPFIDHFRRKSKPRWPKSFEEEEYPFSTRVRDPFVLTLDDMAAIMDPPIAETCHRIGQHLSGLTLQVVIAVGGNSEVPGMVPRLRTMLKEKGIIQRDEQVMHLTGQTDAVIQGLHYWTNHPRLFSGRYARVTLAREVLRDIKELPADLLSRLPSDDAKEEGYYRCAQHIMTEGDLAPDGTKTVDIFCDVDLNARKVDVEPLVLCIPRKGSERYISGPDTWNFASECQPIGAAEISPLLRDIKVAELQAHKAKGGNMKRRLWLRLRNAVGVDIAITMSWRQDGRRIKADAGVNSAKLAMKLDLPGGRFTDEFRAPIRPRESSGANISHDTLPHHLQVLSSSHASQESLSTPPKDLISEGKATMPREEHLVITPALSDHGSSGSVHEATLTGRKRSFAQAMGGNERSTRPGFAPQDFPHGTRGQYSQHGTCPPYLPSTHIPVTRPLGSLLPAMAEPPKPPRVQANPVTHATLDMLNIAATCPPLGMDQFSLSELWTLNLPPGSEHHKFSGTQQFIPPRTTSDRTTSMGPAHVASTYSGYDGSQLLQGIVPQRMSPYSQTQWAHGQPVRGYESPYVAGTQGQEPALARNNVEGGSLWLSSSGALSWQDYGPAAPKWITED